MKIIRNFIAIILVVFMVVNAFILLQIYLVTETESLLKEKKLSYVFPDGLTPLKTKAIWSDSTSDLTGLAVRYVSSGCIYCRLDFDWQSLNNILEQLNYRTILLLPSSSERFDDDHIFPNNTQQFAFVKMDWVKQFRFTETPTTLIFNNNGQVIWHNNGMLNNDDYQLAKDAVIKNAQK